MHSVVSGADLLLWSFKMRNHSLLLMIVVLPLFFSIALAGEKKKTTTVGGPDNVAYVGMFQADADVELDRTPCQHLRDLFDGSGKATDVTGERPAVCDKVVDVIAGKANPLPEDATKFVRAAKLVTDSQHRIVFTEPGARVVHILDFEKRKYKVLEVRQEERMDLPYGVAVDEADNIYVTDMERGVIAEFNHEGKFKKYIGDFSGERAFEQPTSIAIDSESGRIYVADTKRHFVVIFDGEGKRLASIGKRGGGSGFAEFRMPTDLAVHGQELYVLDKQNRRVQVLNLDGRYKREIKAEAFAGDKLKGLAVDSAGRVFMLSGNEEIGVFGREGTLLFRFGRYGGEQGEFRNPEGLYIDSRDRLYVSDAGNRRVQIFQIANPASKVTMVGTR
jgi:DNA-binding beta-propeller fold protein YncE